MARVNNLNDFLTDVAGAIKTKKGSETAIPAANFDTEILALPSQGTYEQKTLRVSTNGTQTVVPSSGFDAIDELELIVAVPGSAINNQDKTIIQNGTYVADSGYTGLGTVIVNVPQEGVKKFESVAQMQASTGNQEGDLAIVYSSELSNLTEDSVFSSVIFPNTVTITQTPEDYVSAEFMNADDEQSYDRGYCALTSNGFIFNYYSESTQIQVSYSTSDGLTYTRTDNLGNPVEVGVNLKYGSRWGGTEELDSRIGEFMKVSQSAFYGLFEYALDLKDKTQIYIPDVSDITIDGTTLTFNSSERQSSKYVTIDDYLELANTIGHTKQMQPAIFRRNGKICFLYAHVSNGGYRSVELWYAGNKLVFASSTNSTYPTDYFELYTINDDMTYTVSTINLVSSGSKVLSTSYAEADLEVSSLYVTTYYDMDGAYYIYETTTSNIISTNGSLTYNGSTFDNSQLYRLYNAYIPASTQFTLKSASQLPNDIVGYGKTGVITGDGSIWAESDLSIMNNTLLGYDLSNSQDMNVMSTGGRYDYSYGFVNVDSTSNEALIVNLEVRKNLANRLLEIAATRDSDWGTSVNCFVHSKAYFLWCNYVSNGGTNKNYLMMCDKDRNIVFYDKFASYSQTGLLFWGATDDYAYFVVNTGSGTTDAIIRINLNTFEKEVKTKSFNSRGSSRYKYLPTGILAKDGVNMYFNYGNNSGYDETYTAAIMKYNWTNNSVTSIKSTSKFIGRNNRYCDVSGTKAILIQPEYSKASSWTVNQFAVLHDPTTGTTTNISGIKTDARNGIEIYGMYNETLDKYYLFGYNSYFNAGAGFGIYEINSNGTLTNRLSLTTEQTGNVNFYRYVCVGKYAYLYASALKYLKVDLENYTYELKDTNLGYDATVFPVYSWINGHMVMSDCTDVNNSVSGQSFQLRGTISNVPSVKNKQLVAFQNHADSKFTDKTLVRLLNDVYDLIEII